MATVNIYFSLGSNIGDRKKNIMEALSCMDEVFGGHFVALSELIETEPMGFVGGQFLNAAVLYRTSNSEGGAMDVLDKVKAIERAMGRSDCPEYDARGKRIYHSRIIDIDILFYGNERIDNERLTIPHKDIENRPFVMEPLKEIAEPSLMADFPEYFE
ncbi:MAG: 2-amino-4-hydroxy-6-hydroxymethyldihydropteridine diphosphokinase [Bacteroidales bacterium]|nr:2-amino-4-hydroxy-6-hydroxymethyldihydropteridine diphosphokinase [Bacteroidales bacterium]MDY6001112.1 2-amino-4-hydroxy-6-hydroxymethyldihydropteridine diphosphokinase [Candidatus Cryptobacteroides sp.]